MVNLFYDKVKADEKIGHFFNEVVKVDWTKHLPVMYDFWESVILGHATYSGNPMQTHLHLHEKFPMNKSHFEHWLNLFHRNLEENFEGNYTEIARQRALSIATVMQMKILH
jgi:hemoglobin